MARGRGEDVEGMSSRRQAVHEARRRAATEGRLPTAVPDMVVMCDMCTDGHPAGQFVERFRYSRSEGRWLATADTPEVHLRPDGTATNDLVGWGGQCLCARSGCLGARPVGTPFPPGTPSFRPPSSCTGRPLRATG